MKLQGRTAIITGGAHGIGNATAELFQKEGCKVIIWDVREIDPGQSSDSTGFYFQSIDVSKVSQVKSGIEQVLKEFQKVDILVNNAGITRDRSIQNMSFNEWKEVIDINLTGVFNCTQAVIPVMKESGYGRIISASSSTGVRGNFGQTNYAAAKAGVIGMTKTWALELGKYGITANCLAPGLIDTEMTRAIPEEIKRNMIDQIPVGRIGVSADVAHAYLFLASEEAGFINGVCIGIDGGTSR